MYIIEFVVLEPIWLGFQSLEM